jgi:1,3-beta-glucanosyltransferase GAS1
MHECKTLKLVLILRSGIAYQLDLGDPLVDTAQCKRDSSLMKTLGANSIRVYHVIADADHDGCMSAFADAGIYAWIDLDSYHTYILPVGQEPRWTQTQYTAYQQVMDTFQKYDNVAGFFVGNEMLTMGNDSVAAPFIKAAARDMKSYRDRKGYRDIPIGYSAADIPDLRPNLQNYLACGSDSADTVDFYSLNVSSRTCHLSKSSLSMNPGLRVVWRFFLYGVWL